MRYKIEKSSSFGDTIFFDVEFTVEGMVWLLAIRNGKIHKEGLPNDAHFKVDNFYRLLEEN
jgi:hypothetical protein